MANQAGMWAKPLGFTPKSVEEARERPGAGMSQALWEAKSNTEAPGFRV